MSTLIRAAVTGTALLGVSGAAAVWVLSDAVGIRPCADRSKALARLQQPYQDLYSMEVRRELLVKDTGTPALLREEIKSHKATITLERWMQAFLSGPLFRMERVLLYAVGFRKCSDNHLTKFISREDEQFAAWTVVEATDATFVARAGPFTFVFEVETYDDVKEKKSDIVTLYFGSGVDHNIMAVPAQFHRLYTRALMLSALTWMKLNRPT
eukprot:m.3533 g.3533  ORF g.3533 m.3533 type:complete len:211 (-) comp2784_c0_seq2:38-670(-)